MIKIKNLAYKILAIKDSSVNIILVKMFVFYTAQEKLKFFFIYLTKVCLSFVGLKICTNR